MTIAHPEQVILESDPYLRLATPGTPSTLELADAVGFDDDFFVRLTSQPRSKVSFDIEETDDWVKLTVVPGSAPDRRRRPPCHRRGLAYRLVQAQDPVRDRARRLDWVRGR